MHKLVFFSNGSCLAVELINTGAIYDIQTSTQIATFEHEGGKNMYLSLSCQDDRIITGTDDGKVKI